MSFQSILGVLAAGLALAMPAPLPAAVAPRPDAALAAKAVRHPGLHIPAADRRAGQLAPQAAETALGDLATLGVPEPQARLDLRGGRWSTLILTEPLLPGRGAGNTLRWESFGPSGGRSTAPADPVAVEKLAWEAFTGWLEAHRGALRIDPVELPSRGQVSVHRGGERIQIYAPRLVDGLPVRGSYLTAVIRHGNLVLFGAHHWGDVAVSTAPRLSAEEALAAARRALAPLEIRGTWGKTELAIVPLARGASEGGFAPGRGYEHRLVWTLRPRFEGLGDEEGRWELLLDAHSGEVLSFEDTVEYATARRVQGGVYPLSNDGAAPDGIEQPGWPMPFDRPTAAGVPQSSDSGGNLAMCVDGTLTSRLLGSFVGIDDHCGSVSLSGTGDLDFGTSAGTDCVTPGLGGAGNTHAARTSYYHLNRIQEQARGQLPANVWLQSRLTANTNISSLCAASWDGAAVNFYCTAAGCANTGELAGVIAHEWGHGMDDNDAVPTISSPGEGIADLYAYLATADSCIGRGFLLGTPCGGYGDACLTCDGARDIDFANRASGLPHDVAWIDLNCNSGNPRPTPCGGITHCEGAVYAEAVYDLIHRDLPALFGMGLDTARELGTLLTYEGGGAVGTWFQCVAPFGGCNADGGYLNFLAADDTNGDLTDGTPHMSAIFAAFDRHGIACDVPSVADSGCAGTPAAAPVVNATPRDRGVELTWGAVAGAASYRIFRTDGVSGCDFGKALVGETSGTSFVDTGLQNGRAYSYVVIPVGPGDSCLGPASACTGVTAVPGPHLALDAASQELAILSVADGDRFLDNCELAELRFPVENLGTGNLTNVRITGVTSPSHPGVSFVTAFPAPASPATLAPCDTGTVSFQLIAGGLAFGDTLELVVEVTADELPAPETASLFVELTESDFLPSPSTTFTFDADLERWQVVRGTFNRTDFGGGAELTPFYLASSQNLPNQCDHARSPLLRLTASSTLTLFTEFDIEGLCTFPTCFPVPLYFDRANVGVFDVDAGTRTAVVPDGGRLYSASGPFGTCGTNGQPGWADTAVSWGPSTWSAAALGAPGLAGRAVQLDVRYGTDGTLQGEGFHFDQVTLTDFDLQGADTQSDVCAVQCAVAADCDDGLFCNGVEGCIAGVCVVGTPPCDDGVACTVDTCDEAADACAATPNDALCSNGLFCDGVEVCDPVLGCQPGLPVDCADGVGCTQDICNETTDVCDHLPDDALCDNAVFCDGAETCDAALDCQPGTDPCAPLVCDEVAGACVGQLEAGSVTVGAVPVTVSLTRAYKSPVVVASVQYAASTTPVVTRVSNVTSTSFDVRLQNPSNGPVTAETVHWLVVEEGRWNLDGNLVEAQTALSTVTDFGPDQWFGETQSYLGSHTSPVVLGQVMSENDPAWSVFWTYGNNPDFPPTPTVLRTGKMVGRDPNTVRAPETLGFVVFEAGHGSLGGVELEARLGLDIVGSIDDGPPFVYTFSTPFAAPPSVALVTTQGQEGTDGTWAYTFGDPMSTASQLFLSNDEDQIVDAERNHTPQVVAYAVFGAPVVYPAPGQCAVDADCSDGVFCNGAERCVSTICLAGADPCPGLTCDEVGDVCLGPLIFLNGFESGSMGDWSEWAP